MPYVIKKKRHGEPTGCKCILAGIAETKLRALEKFKGYTMFIKQDE